MAPVCVPTPASPITVSWHGPEVGHCVIVARFDAPPVADGENVTVPEHVVGPTAPKQFPRSTENGPLVPLKTTLLYPSSSRRSNGFALVLPTATLPKSIADGFAFATSALGVATAGAARP